MTPLSQTCNWAAHDSRHSGNLPALFAAPPMRHERLSAFFRRRLPWWWWWLQVTLIVVVHLLILATIKLEGLHPNPPAPQALLIRLVEQAPTRLHAEPALRRPPHEPMQSRPAPPQTTPPPQITEAHPTPAPTPEPVLTTTAATEAAEPTPAPAPAHATSAPATTTDLPVTEAKIDATYLHISPSEYPALAEKNGEEGTVWLRIRVSAEGLPLSPEVKKGSGYPRLDAAAKAAAQHWRFSPARRGNEAVESEIIVPCIFKLDA